MTAISRIRTGAADHIGGYTDAVAVSGRGTQIFVSGTPSVRDDGTLPQRLHRRSPAVPMSDYPILGDCDDTGPTPAIGYRSSSATGRPGR